MSQSLFEEDRAICLHRFEDNKYLNSAVVPPTYSNTLFTYPSFENLAEADSHQHDYYVYSRGMNPTVDLAERKLAALERGEQCKCFSSGMAAITAALFNSVKSGDHVLAVGNVYKSTLHLLKYLTKFQVKHSIVYSLSMEEIKQAVRSNTKVIFLESPTNLKLRLVDLQAVASFARSHGIRTIIDNTWATPLFQKPLLFGFDIVVHSASKYLGGHSDVMGGAVVTNSSIMEPLFSNEYLVHGGIMVPDEAIKLLRGLRTLPLRMKIHEKNAYKVALFLEKHEKVKTVNYPGLPSHPDYSLGKKQMTGCSGLLTFELDFSSFQQTAKIINKMKRFRIGVSWGSFESLVWSPNYGENAANLEKKQHLNPGLIRLAVGQENADELIEDLNQALR